MDHFKISVLLLGVVAVAPAGCKGKPAFVPVEGTVSQGGKPLAGVIVEFHPEAGPEGLRSNSELTDAAGRYRLRCAHGEEGALVGTHRVCILDTRNVVFNVFGRLPKQVLNSKEGQKKVTELKKEGEIKIFLEPSRSPPRIPERYNRPNETPLRVEVRPGELIINLEVEVIKRDTKK